MFFILLLFFLASLGLQAKSAAFKTKKQLVCVQVNIFAEN
jgi:hypothetical protein